MGNGWTEERRKKQAAAIRQWQPWAKSTGPKSKEGKGRASLNALKHGRRSKIFVAYNQALKLNRDFLALVQAALAAETQQKRLANELLQKRGNSNG